MFGNNAETILFNLLNKLKESQSYCPYCGGEKIHDAHCILDGLWFKNEIDGFFLHTGTIS